jgi:putative CocE/NonD family hydrolase
MRDGVRLAVDVHLPQPLQPGSELPTIVIMTRYFRREEEGEKEYLGWRVAQAAGAGYASVIIDERGTGASSGTWPYAWSQESMADFAEVVDWVVQQDWSNGKVGSWGGSYLGMTAQLLPTTQHPAVRVIVPTFTQYDLYTDIVFPGGIFNDWFMRVWSEGVLAMDRNEGDSHVRRVDEDSDGSLLAAAIAEHSDNGDMYLGSSVATYRDEMTPLGITVDDISAHTRRDALEQSNVAIYHWGSWMDHGTAQAVISRFLTLSNPQQAVIGAWVHGGFQHASPYRPLGEGAEPPEGIQWLETRNFMSRYLKDDGEPIMEKVLYYYTLGAEEWRSTNVWPLEGTTTERWHFNAGSVLSTSVPNGSDGRDVYAVDFTATSGGQTRWHTAQDGVPVVYPDRRNEDAKLLTYTSEPLAEDTEITGHPVVTLYVSSTHTDGAFYAYLEDIDPSGRVTYVTEGQLRALHRKVSDEAPPYETLVPYHTFEQADGEPLVPGEVTTVTFGLHPTSVLIRAGHRIRIAIAGHDNGLFARIPADGDPVVTVERNAVYASMIELPVVR